ncbi:MAG: DUF4139 domain-containing protein [Ignavibacteriaceae bacterium]|nr:DUF4139 domain-containing protein [Ignavibacteriaceae bacterium]
MNKLIITAFLLLNITGLAQNGEVKSGFVTIYNAGLGVIREVRSFNLPAGVSSINVTDVAQQIDATSVRLKFNGEVIEQNYQYDLANTQKILQRYIGSEIQLIKDSGEIISGKLISVSGSDIVLQRKEGGLFMFPSLQGYRLSVDALPEGLISRPTLKCIFNAKKAGVQDVELTYQTAGMSWNAEYVALLDKDDKNMDLKAWVSLTNNSGTTYKDVKLKLVAGDINRVRPQQAYGGMRKSNEMALMADAAPQFQEQSFFEYHLYTLQRPATLANNETKQVSMFESENIKVTKKFQYRSGWGGYYGGEGGTKVAVVVEFENKQNNNLGIPIPKGRVRMYKSDGESVEFIGEDVVDHTPKDEKISLKVGDAFDVLAEETQTDYRKITDRVHEYSYKIVLKNRKDTDITVDVKKQLGYSWEVVKSSHTYNKADAQNIEFAIPVSAGKETDLVFTIRYKY